MAVVSSLFILITSFQHVSRETYDVLDTLAEQGFTNQA